LAHLFAKFGSSFTSGNWTWIKIIFKKGFKIKFELKPSYITDCTVEVL
jgi:hypothetical protein